MFLTVLLLSPLLLLFALIGFLVGKSLRLFDPDVPAAINFFLIGLLGLGLLLLYGSVELTVILPDRIQRDYLGERVAGPLDLRRLEHQPGIMDPATEWTYALSRAQAARLRRRCRPAPSLDPDAGCVLHSRMDDRVIEEATLRDDDRLRLAELFH